MKHTTLFAALCTGLIISTGALAQTKSETLPSGVIIEHLKEGAGASPTAADTVVALGDKVAPTDIEEGMRVG